MRSSARDGRMWCNRALRRNVDRHQLAAENRKLRRIEQLFPVLFFSRFSLLWALEDPAFAPYFVQPVSFRLIRTDEESKHASEALANLLG